MKTTYGILVTNEEQNLCKPVDATNLNHEQCKSLAILLKEKYPGSKIQLITLRPDNLISFLQMCHCPEEEKVVARDLGGNWEYFYKEDGSVSCTDSRPSST